MGRELMAAAVRHSQISNQQLLGQADALHNQVVTHGKAAIAAARGAGDILRQIKANCKHGAFESYIEENAKFSATTARKYMRLAEGWEYLEEKLGTTQAASISISEGIRLLCQQHEPKRPRATVFPQTEEETTGGQDDECPHGGPHIFDHEACIRCHDPAPGAEADSDDARAEVGPEDAEGAGEEGETEKVAVLGRLFDEASSLYAQLTRLLDQLSVMAPNNSKADAQESLSLSYLDFKAWRKKAES